MHIPALSPQKFTELLKFEFDIYDCTTEKKALYRLVCKTCSLLSHDKSYSVLVLRPYGAIYKFDYYATAPIRWGIMHRWPLTVCLSVCFVPHANSTTEKRSKLKMVWYRVWYSKSLTSHSTQYRSFRRRGALSSDVYLSFSNGGPAT